MNAPQMNDALTGWRVGWRTSPRGRRTDERAPDERRCNRLARGLAHVVNIIDPDVIVLGGGLSQLSHLYERLPHLMGSHIFADRGSVVIKGPKWGDASGSRGAARLWDLCLS